jgi:hypothetical protein
VSDYVLPLDQSRTGISIRRRLLTKTKVQEAASGKEWRTTWYSHPRYRYTIDFDFMRTATAYRELQELFRHLTAHQGAWDSFLFADPEDSVVTDHGFGLGDGATVAFQLQRTLLSTVTTKLGAWPVATTRRTNLCPYSQGSFVAQWSKTTGVAAVDGAGLAPDGTPTASLLTYDGSGTVGQSRASRATSPALVSAYGTSYVASIWLRADAPTTVSISINRPTTSTIAVCDVTTKWQRFFVVDVGDGSRNLAVNVLAGSSASNAAFAIYVWGAQLEVGTDATRYISTAGATSANQDPAFWPAAGDGFEPVYEPAPDLLVKLGGSLGTRRLATWTRTNLCPRSEELNDASWGKVNVTVQTNVGPSPAGGSSVAETLTDDATSAGHYATGPACACVVGMPYVVSAYVKAGTYTGTAWVGMTGGIAQAIDFSLTTGQVSRIGTSVVAYEVVLCANGWWRVSVAVVATATTQRVYVGMGAGNGTYVGSGQTIWVWGTQLELGTLAYDYVATTSAAVARTDYALGANGLVTLAVAPAAGTPLLWSGTFYRRVRLATDEVEAERLVDKIWASKKLELISVKP